MCESVIDEHFRRSLGADYMEIFKNINNKTPKSDTPLASPIPNDEPPQEMSLDLKKSPPTTPQPMDDDATDGNEINNENQENNESSAAASEKRIKKESIEFSVDDHFAKALGDTWKKIKENNEKHQPQSLNLSSNSSTSSDSNTHSNSNSPSGNNCNKKDSLRPCINNLV